MKLATLVRMEPHVESHKSWVKNWLLHSSFPLMCVLFIQIPAFFYFFLFSFFLSHSILKFLSFCCSIFFIFFFHLFISHSLSKFLSFSFLFSLFFSCFYTSLSKSLSFCFSIFFYFLFSSFYLSPFIQIPVLLIFFFFHLSISLLIQIPVLLFIFFIYLVIPHSISTFIYFFFLHLIWFLFLSVTPSSLLLMPLSCFALFLPFFIYCVWNAGQIMHKKHGRADERPDSKFYSFYGKKMICF